MPRETRLDRMLRWFKNNRFFSIILLIVVIVVGASQLMDAISEMIDAGRRVTGPSAAGASSEDSGPSATLLKRIGSSGTGLGYFRDARFLMLDSDRQVIVGEFGDRSRIQRFKPDGTALGQWSLADAGDKSPTTMEASSDGRLVVGNGSKLSEYELNSGRLLKRTELGEMEGFDIIATGSSATGGVLVQYQHEREDDKGDTHWDMFICDYAGALRNCALLTIPKDYYNYLDDWKPRLTLDGDNNLYLLNDTNSFVYKFTRNGEFLTRFGGDDRTSGESRRPGVFHIPESLTVDGKGLVYVKDAFGLQVFDSSGRFLQSIAVPGLEGPEAYGSIDDMSFDRNHNLWAVARDRVCQYRFKL